MQIKKYYQSVNPELLYAEVRDFVLKRGAILDESRLETFVSLGDTSTFVSRGTLIFKVQDKHVRSQKECIRVKFVKFLG